MSQLQAVHPVLILNADDPIWARIKASRNLAESTKSSMPVLSLRFHELARPWEPKNLVRGHTLANINTSAMMSSMAKPS